MCSTRDEAKLRFTRTKVIPAGCLVNCSVLKFNEKTTPENLVGKLEKLPPRYVDLAANVAAKTAARNRSRAGLSTLRGLRGLRANC